MFKAARVGCSAVFVIGSVLILIVVLHESPTRITEHKAAAIEYVNGWLQPAICSQLVSEATDLIKLETQKTKAQREEESGLNWDISRFPVLFGVQLANLNCPIRHSASLVYMRENQGACWTESCFPVKLSIGHRCTILIVVNPAGKLPACYHYEATFTNNQCGSVGFLLREL